MCVYVLRISSLCPFSPLRVISRVALCALQDKKHNSPIAIDFSGKKMQPENNNKTTKRIERGGGGETIPRPNIYM
jgi:hypothetical protein